MREQENALSKSRYLDKISTEDFLEDFDDNDEQEKHPSRFGSRSEKESASRTQSRQSTAKPPSRPSSGRQGSASSKKHSYLKSKPSSSNIDDVAVPDDTFMTSLYQEFSEMSTKHNENDNIDED